MSFFFILVYINGCELIFAGMIIVSNSLQISYIRVLSVFKDAKWAVRICVGFFLPAIRYYRIWPADLENGDKYL